MTETQSVQLAVDTKRLISNLKLAFAGKASALNELCQNARRAGATSIDIEWDEETRNLTVSDNGCGIGDFSVLINVAATGWNNEIVEDETPYGLGLLSALYNSERIKVRSRGRQLDASCEDILAFKPVSVTPCEKEQGVTSFTLVNSPIPVSKESLYGRFHGFPIPVFFNGEALERPHALGSNTIFRESPIGQIHIVGEQENVLDYSKKIVAYYQGMCIWTSCYFTQGSLRQTTNIVHLDSRQFEAVLPDRHRLVDADEAGQRIERCIREANQARIRAAKSSIDEKVLLRAYDTLAYFDLLELLNDIDRIPTTCLAETNEFPVCLGNEDGLGYSYGAPVEDVSREDIIRKRYSVIEIDDERNEYECFRAAMYLHGLEHVATLSRPLHSGHWVYPHIKTLEVEDISVVIKNQRVTPSVKGCPLWSHDVVFCQSVTLRGPCGDVAIQDGFVCDLNGSDKSAVVLIPDADTYGEVIKQANCYQCEFSFDEGLLECESGKMTKWLRNARCADDPLALIYNVVGSDFSGYPALKGQSFVLSINDEYKVSLAPVA